MPVESIRIARVADHSFLSAPIEPASVVIDLGSNTGAFTTGMVAQFGCRVIAIEPVPRLSAALDDVERVTVEPFAITADDGPATLFLNPSTCATIDPRLSQSDAKTVSVSGISLGALLDRHGLERVALVKVDIEGAEHAMIDGTATETLRRVDQFTIEFHDFLDPALEEAVKRTRKRLRAAGFADFSLSADNSDVLFVNLSRLRFGPVRRAAAAITQKYPRGIARRLRRMREHGMRPSPPACSS